MNSRSKPLIYFLMSKFGLLCEVAFSPVSGLFFTLVFYPVQSLILDSQLSQSRCQQIFFSADSYELLLASLHLG
jgi:hypothetical protein